MSTITISYDLSETGRKASLLSGGDGAQTQTITVTTESPDFARAVQAATFGHNGKPSVSGRNLAYFDAIPTAGEILDRIDAAKAASAARELAKAEAKRAATQKVLDERLTTSKGTYGVEGRLLRPAWPYHCDDAVTESPEAVAWVAELTAANEIIRAEYAAEQARKEAETEAKKIAAAERETARRAALGMADDEIDLSIEDGALVEVPSGMWSAHKRGRNWMAVIAVNPSSPGGLDRDFAAKAKGESYYILPDLSPGDAIEFGADYYSGSGRKDGNRWYGYVVRVIPETTDEYGSLILKVIAGGKTAVKEGAKFAASLVTA
jgi:hypothetical protein